MKATRPIELVRIGSETIGDRLIDHLARGLRAALDVPVRDGGRIAADASGGGDSLPSAMLLDELIRARPDDSRWHLGITAADLHAPGRAYVFGEATVGGAWALIGLARFGIPGDPSPALLRRALTEALHEIGHLAGLSHCDDGPCVMAISSGVRDIDRKKSEFCHRCETRLLGTKDP